MTIRTRHDACPSVLRRMRRAIVRRLDREESAFTLVELMVAQGLILASLLSVAYTATVGFQDIALARRRDSANGLANRVMEQVRALPYDVLQAGLRTSDVQADLAPSGAIQTTGCPDSAPYCYRATPTGPLETIAHSGVPPGDNEPLVPHIREDASTTIGPTRYRRAVYVTRYRADVPNDNPDQGVVEIAGAYRVTVVVTWPEDQRGADNRVHVQSVFYSPASTSVHPFAAPRQPFLYGSAQVPVGVVELTATPQGTPLRLASDPPPEPISPEPPEGMRTISSFERARIWTVSGAATAQSEQIATATSRTLTSGIELKALNSQPSVAGQQVVSTFADNDPAQPGQENPPAVSLTGSSSATYSLTGSNTNRVEITTAAADEISSRSVMNASTTNPCSAQLDSQPCTYGTLRQVNPNEIRISVKGNGVDSGTAVLARTSGTAGSDSSVLVHRDLPGAGQEGSMVAEVRRVIGDLRLGALPSSFANALPPGWNGDIGLLRLKGYSGTAAAGAGVGTSLPLSAGVTEGAVQYWNGAGYTTIDLRTGISPANPHCTGSSNGVCSFEVSLDRSVTVGGKTVRVEMRGIFRAGGALTEEDGTSTNRARGKAQLLTPLVGNLRYRISVGTPGEAEHRQVDVTLNVDLGTQDASTSYKASTAA